MSAVLLSGLNELDASEMRALAHVCMNRANWARKVELKDRPLVPSAAPPGQAGGQAAATGPGSRPPSHPNMAADPKAKAGG